MGPYLLLELCFPLKALESFVLIALFAVISLSSSLSLFHCIANPFL